MFSCLCSMRNDNESLFSGCLVSVWAGQIKMASEWMSRAPFKMHKAWASPPLLIYIFIVPSKPCV